MALALAAQGADLAVHYRSSRAAAEATAAAARERGVQALAIAADLADPRACPRLIAECRAALGSLDILINNASIFPASTLRDLEPQDVQRNVEVHGIAPLLLTRELAADGRPGAVINLLDTRVVDYDAQHAAYHLSKRMLFTLTRAMALEFAPAVRVNGIAPGLILPPAGEDESYLERLKHTNPLQSYGSAADVVMAVEYLLRSEFVTGEVLFVDGGRHMRGSLYGL